MHDARRQMMPDHKGGQKEYDCKPAYRLLISPTVMYDLINLGFSPKRLKFTARLPLSYATPRHIKVQNIELIEEKEDTFGFTEPNRNMGMFNGILTAGCKL
jgi:ribonucleoside-diphosphate reductase alpha chain